MHLRRRRPHHLLRPAALIGAGQLSARAADDGIAPWEVMPLGSVPAGSISALVVYGTRLAGVGGTLAG
jgi:hypothetical protein